MAKHFPYEGLHMVRAYHLFKQIIHLKFFLSFFVLTLSLNVIPTPINNYQDPVIFHTVMGSDKYYNATGKANLALHISPFYQHTRAANKPEGGKTSSGNVWGPWNMAGLFLNDAPRPTTKPFTFYRQTKTTIANTRTDPAALLYSKDYTVDTAFNPEEDAFKAVQYQHVNLKYEKMGLRGQLSFDLGVGLGVCVKGGIVNMKNRPNNFILDPAFSVNAGLTIPDAAAANPLPTPSADQKAQAIKIYESLMGKNAQRQLFKEIGFDAQEFNLTDLEDLYAAFYWHIPMKIREQGEHVFSVIPYLSVGASLPLGKDRNYNALYSVINGSDGFTGLTAQGAIALDFPHMMQLSAGGGVTVYNTRTLTGYHVPTSDFQSGIYPWTTSITRQPGSVWYVNISMKADDIMSKKDVPNFSVFFDYIYAEHLHDSIALKETNATFARFFKPEMLERDSAWKAQMVHAGVKLGLSKNIYLTFSSQNTIGGSRTYRPTTLLGGLIASF